MTPEFRKGYVRGLKAARRVLAECRAELATRIGGDVKFKTGPLEMAIEDLATACRRGDMDGAVRLVRRALAIAKDLYSYTVELNELAERAARA